MSQIKDGEIFKTVTAFGKSFVLRYGYYEEFERRKGEPVPIYPDFRNQPRYTDDGHPFVTQMQELCQYGTSSFREGYCVDCAYYHHGEDLIGICLCEQNKNTTT